MRQLSILIACECSGRMRDAFRARGWDAWSCDLKPDETGTGPHIQGDALEAIHFRRWDAMIAHPVCRYLTNSGVCWLYDKDGGRNEQRWIDMQAGADFFRDLVNAPIRFKAIENPIQHKYAVEAHGCGKASQFVQPWMFGHPEQKATGFWLRNLPPLKPTNNVKDYMMTLPDNQRQRIHYMPPGPDREAERSRTLPGIAQACADQWGAFMEKMLLGQEWRATA